MPINSCWFCNSPAESRKVSVGYDFICSACWKVFTSVSREDLEKVLITCKQKGYGRKALAIEHFLRLGNPEKTPKPLRNPPRPP